LVYKNIFYHDNCYTGDFKKIEFKEFNRLMIRSIPSKENYYLHDIENIMDKLKNKFVETSCDYYIYFNDDKIFSSGYKKCDLEDYISCVIVSSYIFNCGGNLKELFVKL
jgi:hypothetical protein